VANTTGRAILAQTRLELKLTLRRGENLLVTIVIPLVLLVFFASAHLIPGEGQQPLDYLVPGILSMAIISTGMVNLGIATAYERYYGVLKRLGGSPLPRWGLLVAKALSVLALEVFQVAAVLAVAVVGFGWTPRVQPTFALLALVLGTLAFSALGLAMAGGLRAEATLAIANGLYLLFVLLGDVFVPISHLPPLLQPLGQVLPASALSETLRFAFGGTAEFPTAALALLASWTVVAGGLAIRAFRWE
jgi:ABC-2 type transport system permease protein